MRSDYDFLGLPEASRAGRRIGSVPRGVKLQGRVALAAGPFIMCIKCEASEEGREIRSGGGSSGLAVERLGGLEAEAASRQVVAQLMALSSHLGCEGALPVDLGSLAGEHAAADLSDRTRATVDLVERALLVELACISRRVEMLRGSDLAQLMPSAGNGMSLNWRIWGSFRILGAMLSCLAELAVTSTPSLARLRRFGVEAGVLTLELQGSATLLLVGDPEFGNLDRIAKGRSNVATVIRVHTVRRCLEILGAEMECHREPAVAAGIRLRIPVRELEGRDGGTKTP